MFEELEKKIRQEMEKTIAGLKNEYARLRSGRATPALLDGIRVEYYGALTPLNQMATVNAPEARLLVVQPWDPSALQAIEKAILKSDIGLSPQNDGRIIRLPIPALTEERRKELGKVVNKFAEEARVSVRNHRRDGMEDLKKMQKDKKVSEDDSKREEKRIQEFTDSYIKKVDEVAAAKSKEILEV
jgi:ribosome recycling factor